MYRQTKGVRVHVLSGSKRARTGNNCYHSRHIIPRSRCVEFTARDIKQDAGLLSGGSVVDQTGVTGERSVLKVQCVRFREGGVCLVVVFFIIVYSPGNKNVFVALE